MQAGVMEDGVISSLASNIDLHEMLDRWFEQEVKPRLHGLTFVVRFADDAPLALSGTRTDGGCLKCWPSAWRVVD